MRRLGRCSAGFTWARHGCTWPPLTRWQSALTIGWAPQFSFSQFSFSGRLKQLPFMEIRAAFQETKVEAIKPHALRPRFWKSHIVTFLHSVGYSKMTRAGWIPEVGKSFRAACPPPSWVACMLPGRACPNRLWPTPQQHPRAKLTADDIYKPAEKGLTPSPIGVIPTHVVLHK